MYRLQIKGEKIMTTKYNRNLSYDKWTINPVKSMLLEALGSG